MTSEREKIIRYYKASGDDAIASRLVDLAEIVLKNKKYKISDFLDPYSVGIAETVVAHFSDLYLDFNGGFQNAERVKVAFIHKEFPSKPLYDLSAVKVMWSKRFYDISHKDVLGALMAVGCDREVLGDIVFTEDGAQFVISDSVIDFFLNNLTQIGAASVSVEKIDIDSLVEKEEKVKEIKGTVAALRLDAIAALGYGVSRSRMADEIKNQRVRVNWKDAKNPAQSVVVGDIISFRSRGRLEVSEIKGLTKKGRTSILLKRYI